MRSRVKAYADIVWQVISDVGGPAAYATMKDEID